MLKKEKNERQKLALVEGKKKQNIGSIDDILAYGKAAFSPWLRSELVNFKKANKWETNQS